MTGSVTTVDQHTPQPAQSLMARKHGQVDCWPRVQHCRTTSIDEPLRQGINREYCLRADCGHRLGGPTRIRINDILARLRIGINVELSSQRTIAIRLHGASNIALDTDRHGCVWREVHPRQWKVAPWRSGSSMLVVRQC